MGAEQGQLSRGTVKRRKLACFGRVTRHDSLSRTIHQGHLGGWATLWSAEEMLNGQHQRVGILAHATGACNSLHPPSPEPQKKKHHHVPPTTKLVKRLN